MSTFNIKDYYSSDLRPVEEAQLEKITWLVGRLVAAADAKRDKKVSKSLVGRISKSQIGLDARIIAAIRANPGLLQKDIAEIVGCSEVSVWRRVQALKGEGE